jgi:hypothetical protein
MAASFDQRPQHGQQVVRVLVGEAEHLRDDLVTRARGAFHLHRAGLQLGIGLGHHLEQAVRFDDGIAQPAQRGGEDCIGLRARHRLLGVDAHPAPHARVQHDGPVEDGRHRARHGFHIGIGKVQRHAVRAACLGGREAQRETQPQKGPGKARLARKNHGRDAGRAP